MKNFNYKLTIKSQVSSNNIHMLLNPSKRTGKYVKKKNWSYKLLMLPPNKTINNPS